MADTPKYGNKIEEYKLPITDVQKSKRNFPGVEEKEYYTIEDMKAPDQAGTSDTDSQTDKDQKGYGAIYKKHGNVKDWSGKKLGLEPKYDKNVSVDSDHKKVTPVVGNTMSRGQ